MFMNAGATAPEWASGIKMGTFTRALNAGNGDVAITGVGFKPSALIVFWAGPAAYTSGMGFADASVEYCMFSYPTDNYHSWSGTSLMQIYSAAGKIDVAVLKTFDTDGFTLTWAQSGSPTGTANIAYLALR